MILQHTDSLRLNKVSLNVPVPLNGYMSPCEGPAASSSWASPSCSASSSSCVWSVAAVCKHQLRRFTATCCSGAEPQILMMNPVCLINYKETINTLSRSRVIIIYVILLILSKNSPEHELTAQKRSYFVRKLLLVCKYVLYQILLLQHYSYG